MRLIPRLLALSFLLAAGAVGAQPRLMLRHRRPVRPVGPRRLRRATSSHCGLQVQYRYRRTLDTLYAPITGDVNINTGTNHATINPNVVNADLAQVPGNTIKCNPTGGITNPIDCTGAQVGGILGISGISGLFSYAQLSQLYPSGVAGYPSIGTNDVGSVFCTGTVWAPLASWNVLRGAVPIGIPPNGTIGNNGALTLGTALDRVYPAIYLRFPSGALYTGSPATLYYTVCSTTTVCTV